MELDQGIFFITLPLPSPTPREDLVSKRPHTLRGLRLVCFTRRGNFVTNGRRHTEVVRVEISFLNRVKHTEVRITVPNMNKLCHVVFIQSDPDLVFNFLHRGKFILSLNRDATKSGVTKSGSDCNN
eukprot:sb/3475545/